MPNTTESIVELHQVLVELKEQTALYEGVPESMSQLHEEREAVKAQIAVLEEQLQRSELERRSQDGAAAEFKERIEHLQGQIGQVTTQREYGALLSEIDGAKENLRTHEEASLGELESSEEATTQKSELEERFKTLDADYQEQLAEWEEQRPAVKERIDRLQAQVDVVKGKLPASVLAHFDRLFERHDGDPLAKVHKIERSGSGPAMWRCSVCNYSVRPQIVVEIQRSSELVMCECGRQRIFFIETAE